MRSKRTLKKLEDQNKRAKEKKKREEELAKAKKRKEEEKKKRQLEVRRISSAGAASRSLTTSHAGISLCHKSVRQGGVAK